MRRKGKHSLLIPALLGVLGVPARALAEGATLNLEPNPTWVVLNLVVFALLLYPTQRLLLGPLVRILEEREERTTGALSRAATLREQTSALQVDLEARLTRTRADAAVHRGRILEETEAEERQLLEAARAETARTLETVRSRIAEELEVARQTLREDAPALAREAVARILGRSL